MKSRVTAQDIADELGLSRNTVSKAFNGTGSISDETKERILKKAIELGYKQYAYMDSKPLNDQISKAKEIALLTCSMPNTSHFGFNLLSTFEAVISKSGYRLAMYMVREDDINAMNLPINFNPDTISGLVCIEMFSESYNQLICNLGLPTLFIDTCVINPSSPLKADILLMESYNSVYSITKTLIDNNYLKIGFLGDKNHCLSFYERWLGYKNALIDYNLSYSEDFCILDKDSAPYSESDWLCKRIKGLQQLPQAFICSNDYQAINAIKAIKRLGLSVPEDILIIGFDDSPESKIIEPHLTTVHIPNSEMGAIAANQLLYRIQAPESPFSTIHVQTQIKKRSSSGSVLFSEE